LKEPAPVLKGINPLLNPPLLHVLAAMGHGDELTIVDRNYPAYAAGCPVIHLDGVTAPTAVTAVLELLPLDDFVDHPLLCMQQGHGATTALPVHTEIESLACAAEGRAIGMAFLTRGVLRPGTRLAGRRHDGRVTPLRLLHPGQGSARLGACR
jgi:L-fucose mutarotase